MTTITNRPRWQVNDENLNDEDATDVDKVYIDDDHTFNDDHNNNTSQWLDDSQNWQG